LRQLKRRCGRFEIIYLDSPDTGCISGQFLATSKRRLPTDDPLAEEQYWVDTNWFYMGGTGDGERLPDGICGNAMWNEEGDAVGFFQYAPDSGCMPNCCTGVSAAS